MKARHKSLLYCSSRLNLAFDAMGLAVKPDKLLSFGFGDAVAALEPFAELPVECLNCSNPFTAGGLDSTFLSC